MRTLKMLAVAAFVAACGPKVSTIEVAPQKVTITKKGDTVSLAAVAKNDKGVAVDNVALTYASSAADVASVDEKGTVTGVATGDATVKVSFQDKVTSEVPVTVSIPATVAVSPTTAKLEPGQTAKVSAKVLDAKGRDVPVEITWETSAANVATVANGEIAAVGVGQAQVFATAAGIKSTPVEVTVAGPPVDSLEVDKKASVKVGATVSLKVVAKNEGKPVANPVLTFTSADPKIATVEKGEVKGVKAGKTKITVAAGEKSAVCTVTVKK